MRRIQRTMAALGAALCGCLGGFAANAPGSDAYVKDGLVAHWDGIDNTLKDGVRSHDAAATTWCDLSGQGNDVAIPSFVKVESNALLSMADRGKKPDTDAKAKVKYPTFKALKGLRCGPKDAPFTVEVVAQRVKWTYGDNYYNLQTIFGTPRGAIGYRNHDETSGFFYVLYPSSPREFGLMNWYARREPADLHTISLVLGENVATCAAYLDAGTRVSFADNTGYPVPRRATDGFALFSNPRADIRIHAIRVYNRTLTDAERARNHRLDAARFTSADTAAVRAVPSVDFTKPTRTIRRALHSSGFGPLVCSCPQVTIDDVKSMNLYAARTHDWALINPAERVCDYFHIFPLMHLDATDPKNYHFGPTDYLLKRTREETKMDIFFRLGTSIEHSGPVYFNAVIPDDFDKVAETFAGTIRHYNKGWANGFNWDIKYWEIWNEPDGGGMWCPRNGTTMTELERRDLFVKFFVTALKRLKREFPEVKVGGPALCSMNAPYFKALLKGCQEAGVAPDFISWHSYSQDADAIMAAADQARKICDDFGFTKCELIINEWHFFGNYSWSDLRSRDPVVRARTLTGPGAHNGIDAAVFTLETLAKFQTSKYDQAYYYGCRHNGSWGFKDYAERKYKTYYALKMFGEIVSQYTQLVDAKTPVRWMTPFAGLSADGKKGFVFLADYGGTGPLTVDVAGVAQPKNVRAVVLDYTRNLEPVAVKWTNGRLELPRKDANSVAFLVTFDL